MTIYSRRSLHRRAWPSSEILSMAPDKGAPLVGRRITEENAGRGEKLTAQHVVFEDGQPAGDGLASIDAEKRLLHRGIERLRLHHRTGDIDLDDAMDLGDNRRAGKSL